MEPTHQTAEYFTDVARSFRRQYDTDPAFRERFDVWSGMIQRLAPEARSLIDVGCGPGMFALHYARKGLRVVGVDASPGMVAFSEEQRRKEGMENATFLVDRLPDLAGFRGEAADLVLCSSVLEYVPDIKESLKRLKSLLLPGGLLMVSLPNLRSPYRGFEALAYRMVRKPAYLAYVVNRLTSESLASLAESTGLMTIDCIHYAHGDLLSRVLRRVGLPASLTGNLFVSAMRQWDGERRHRE